MTTAWYGWRVSTRIRSFLAPLAGCALVLLATGCGGGKRKAEHARSERPSTLPGSAAPAAPATATAAHCQVDGFAYVVPGPGNILPPAAAPAPGSAR